MHALIKFFISATNYECASDVRQSMINNAFAKSFAGRKKSPAYNIAIIATASAQKEKPFLVIVNIIGGYYTPITYFLFPVFQC